MTIVITVLIGTGVLFIASALDNTPIVETFQKIIKGQHIDWTGGNASSTSSSPVLNNPNPDGSCPPGSTPVRVSGGKLMCRLN